MSERYEYYNTGYDNILAVYAHIWEAQTFTPLEAHKVTSVWLRLRRYGSPGEVTVSIRDTDESGQPTGPDLCIGTTNGNTLNTSTFGAWREITLGDGYDLDDGTKYAIVVRALAGNTSNLVYWVADNSGNYPRGREWYSNNHGSSWVGHSWIDCMFEEWGEAIAPPPAGRSYAFIFG